MQSQAFPPTCVNDFDELFHHWFNQVHVLLVLEHVQILSRLTGFKPSGRVLAEV